jgi:TPR repeat protein
VKNFGICLQNGEGVEKNLSRAAEFYEKAISIPAAKYRLGTLYQNAWGVEQDLARAFQLFEQSALEGHAGSQCKIAIFYERGVGAFLLSFFCLLLKFAKQVSSQVSRKLIIGIGYFFVYLSYLFHEIWISGMRSPRVWGIPPHNTTWE